MLTLRIAVVAVAVIFTGATESNVEHLEATFYGLDESFEPPGPELIGVVESTDPRLAAANASQPTATRLPDVDGDAVGRRRHHHQHHHGRHHHRQHGGGEGRRSHHHHHHGMRHGWSGNWTDEQKMTHICSRLQSRDTPVASAVAYATSAPRTDAESPRNDIHSKLRALDESSRQTIIRLWNRRKQEMLRCCNESTMEAKMQCVNSAKAARYNRVCSGDEPLCPWSAARFSSARDVPTTTATPNNGTESMTSITTRCCAARGAERVQCFVDAKNSYRQRMQQNPHGSRHGTRGRADRRRDHHHQ